MSTDQYDDDIESAVETVAPEIATKWLEQNYDMQRPLRWGWVQQLAARMTGGRWRVTHQGIAFGRDGKLLDGQHRLWAIVESGKSVRMMVSRNVPPEAFGVLDQHRIRTVADLAESKWITPRIVASARSMVRGPVQSHVGTFDDRDPTLLIPFIEDHQEDIERVLALIPTAQNARGRRNLTAVVTGALLRASLHVPLKALHRFIEVLISGETAGVHERPAILLRDWIMSSTTRDRSTEYQKTQRAIQAFVDSDPISVLYAQPDDLFPIPDIQVRRPLRVDPARTREAGARQRREKPVIKRGA